MTVDLVPAARVHYKELVPGRAGARQGPGRGGCVRACAEAGGRRPLHCQPECGGLELRLGLDRRDPRADKPSLSLVARDAEGVPPPQSGRYHPVPGTGGMTTSGVLREGAYPQLRRRPRARRHVGPLLAETGPASGASLPNVLIAKVGQVPLVVPRGPLGHVHLAVAGCGIMGRLLLCGGGRWRAGRRARLPASGKKRRGANSVDAGGGHEQGPAAGQGLQWPIA